ncbi:Linear gramicidin synthase subunit D [compost metagenome]
MSDLNKRLASLTPEQRRLLAQKLEEKKTAARPFIPSQARNPQGSVLSFAQQRLWLLDQLEPDTSLYNIPLALRFTGELDIDALRQSLAAVVARHEALRTRFVAVDGKPLQVVDSPEQERFEWIAADLTAHAGDTKGASSALEAVALSAVNAESVRPFDLEKGPLVRGWVGKLGEQEHILLVTFHHIVFDGWSLSIFQNELLGYYGSFVAGAQLSLPALPIQYADFAVWQRERLTDEAVEKQLDYWKKKLSAAESFLELPTDRPRPAVQSFRGDITSVPISEETAAAMRELSRREGASLFMTLLAAFQALLFRYTGQRDFSIGTPVANRGLSEIEGLIGFFVNTLVMRADLSGRPTFRELLRQVKQTAIDAYANQDLPFDRVVEALSPERSLSHAPLYQVVFTLDSAPDAGFASGTAEEHSAGAGALSVEPYAFESRSAKFDLTLTMFDTGSQGLIAQMEYSTDLFEESTIRRLLGHLNKLLQGVASNSDAPIETLPLLGEEERVRLLHERNRTQADYPADKLVHELIEEQALLSPESPALQADGRMLTFGELNDQANRLACHLRKLGATRGTLVGMLAERSFEQVIGLLAIWKAGGAYLPIDPAYPEERVSFMLEDSQVPILLAQQRYATELKLGENGPIVVVLEDPAVYEEPGNEAKPAAGSPSRKQLTETAYVIYTSGSTGRPKGVEVGHKGLLNLVFWHQRSYSITTQDKGTLFAGPAFDASVWELWPYLAVGACVCIPDRDVRIDPSALRDWLTASGVTVSFLPTPMAEAILAFDWPKDSRLRFLLTGGDRLRQYPRARLPFVLVNHYGPTESTVVATAGVVSTADASSNVPSHLPNIGHPIANTQVYLLDAQGELVPDGVAGELHVGGDGLALGYLHHPELTNERFIANPFQLGTKLYRTGDLARFMPDGSLDFIGRTDDQVKVRGYRIELGEVEKAMTDYADVQEAVALVKEIRAGDQRLIAYVTPAVGVEASRLASELRTSMKERLPDYMVPSVIMVLEQLPVTPNGKIDRRALPEPDQSMAGNEYAAPRTAEEQQLARIWSDVLGVENVGVHDNFFELGGDSILSIQIVSRARQAGLHMTPKQLFQHQTIAELAPSVGKGKILEAEQGLVTGAVPLTPIQRWFFEREFQAPQHFNQSMMFEVHTSLNAELLRKTVWHLLAHHDALRLTFTRAETGWEQTNGDLPEQLPFEVLDLSDLQPEEQQVAIESAAAEIQAGFKITEGVLLRAVYMNLGLERYGRLLLVIHHLGVDGVSWRILIEDLHAAAGQLLEGKAVQLPEKTTAFRDWAGKLSEYAASDVLRNEADYWLAQAGKRTGQLPSDFRQGPNTIESSRDHVTFLTPTETRVLLQDVPLAYRTQINDVLLTALLRAMTRWTGQQRLLLHLEGHGREDMFEEVDLSRTVGWFTSMFPVVLELPEKEDAGSALKSVKEQLRRLPNRGIGYGLLRYLASPETAQELERIGAAIVGTNEPQISFNYLGQFDQSLGGGGEDDLFRPAGESTGPEQDPRELRAHDLDVTGLVAGGVLRLTWTYSEHLHRQETVEQVSELFLEELRALIEHCSRPETRGVTPSDYPLAQLRQDQLDALIGTGQGVEDVYPLTPMQQGMLFHTVYSPESLVYFEQMSWRLEGDFRVDAMESAWNRVIQHHQILRTAFFWDELDDAHQVVYASATIPTERLDWRLLTEEEREAKLEVFHAADRVRGFDVSKPPLMRLAIIRLTDDSYQYVWSYHHLLLDGWSMNALVGQVLTCYQDLIDNCEPQLEPIRPYSDYIAWMQKQSIGKAEVYWRQTLRGFSAPTPLTIERRVESSGAQEAEYGREKLSMPDGLYDRLQQLSRQHQVTVNTLVQGAWSLLLSLYSGEDDVVFGATVSGRPADLEGVESMMGIFINTLPVRVKVPADRSVLSWLQELQAKQVEQRDYEYSPLSMVQTWCDLPRGTSLFESLFVFENYPASAAVSASEEEGGVSVSSMALFEQTNFPLTLFAIPDMGLNLMISYDTNKFAPESIGRMLSHLQMLLEGMAADPQQPLSELRLLTAGEYEQIVVQWNATPTDYDLEQTLHGLLEAQAARTPEFPAIVFEATVLTYEQLHTRANQLARHLQKLGVGPDVLVAVAMERSVEMVVALFGILKAGGAYVPMDPEYPMDRLTYMFEDTNSPILLTQGRLLASLPEYRGHVLALDEQWELIARESGDPVESAATPGSACYMIYTSGSTGRPKGVVNIHRALINRLMWMQDAYQLTEADRVLQKTPFSFDVSVWEFFWPLITGAALVIARPGGHRDTAYLRDLIADQQITTLHFVPSMLQIFLEEENLEQCGWVRQVMCSGEALPYDLQQRFFERIASAELHNLYGPTEAAIDVTHWTCRRQETLGMVPIGRPIANTQIYLLDRHLHPVPVGVPGELHIGGVGLAREYLNRAELTAEKFIPDPFTAKPEARLYKTGDLARYLPDGTIEYMGRLDHQVKIRGFRIELGEIESVLAGHPDIQEAAVIDREDTPGHKRLVAYVVLVQGGSVPIAELRRFLLETLPDYMVPAAFVFLDVMPLTPNGKLDRKALPAPSDIRPDADKSYVAPRSEAEQIMAQVWTDVLGMPNISIHDNYFELGGDSILSLQVVSRVRKSGLHITPKQVFENPTIAQLVAASHVKEISAEQGEVTGELPLTPVQIWFFEHELADRHHWNQSTLLAIRQPVNADVLQQSFRALAGHHDALRLRFVETESGWAPSIISLEEAESSKGVTIERIDLSVLSEDKQQEQLKDHTERLQESLNLTRGPIFRAALFDFGADQPARLFIAIHHLAVDAVSWRILTEDLLTAYEQILQGASMELPTKTTSIREWSQRLAAYAQTTAAEEELDLWLRHTGGEREGEGAGIAKLLQPGADRAANTVASSRTLTVSLEADETKALLQEVPAVYRTQINDVLLTALLLAFYRATGQTSLRLDMEGHGREELFDDVDVSRTVGWFTSVYPLRLELLEDGCAGDNVSQAQVQPAGETAASSVNFPLGVLLKNVKEQLRRIPQRGIGYGLLRYLSRNPFVREQLDGVSDSPVMFNYLGQMDQGEGGDGLFTSAYEETGLDGSSRGQRRYLLDIAGVVSGGSLHVSWIYSVNLFSDSQIEQLVGLYLEALRDIIAHCRTERAGGVTPSDFPLVKLSQAQLDRLYEEDRRIRDIYPLTPMQAGMLFHSLTSPDSGVYCEQSGFTLRGVLHAEAFEQAWKRLIERHDILRTRIEWEGLDQPVQVLVDAGQALPHIEQVDLRGYAPNQRSRELEAYLEADRLRGFDFTKAPIMRFALIQLEEDQYQFVWTFHHLLLDGWSNPIVIQEFFALYQALSAGGKAEGVELEPVRPFRDYIAWLHKQDKNAASGFWTRYLDGIEAPTPLPLERSSGEAPSYRELHLHLSETETAELQAFARSHQLTLNVLVQGAWALLLSRYSGESDVVFGSTVSGRPADLEGVETMVGLFINTLPVRAQLPADATVLEWLRQLQAEQIEQRQYEYAALSQIQGWSEVPHGTPLFDSLIVYENYPIQVTVSESDAMREASATANTESADSDLELLGIRTFEQTNYSITLSVVPGERLDLSIGFDPGRYAEPAVGRMLEHLQLLLRQLSAAPQRKLDKVAMLTEAEQELLCEWNATEAEYPQQTVHELIDRQAKQTPEATALVTEAETLTYRELNARANQLARYLQEQGLGPEMLVGICAERSPELAVAILGVLKAGGAYVPLDPAYPKERLAYMIEDAGMSFLLTQERLTDSLPDHAATTIRLDADWPAIAEQSVETPKSEVIGEHAAYVIYTSGSTGKPKGVVVPHGALLNHNLSVVELYELSREDCILQFATISFDAAVEEMLPTWLCGAALVMPKERLMSLLEFTRCIEKHSLSVINLPTAYWHEWVHELAEGGIDLPESVRAVIIGGERPSPERFAQWQRIAGDRVAWFNTYGPTEATIICTAFRAPKPDEQGGPFYEEVPIGKPIANTRIYLLDRNYQQVPPGVPGELYVAGSGLARGYWNRPDLTAEQFIPHPFKPEERLYRTGDLARYRADGNIEYLGRKDYQVKIRGFRIELEEVESTLAQHEGIRHAIALAREDRPGEKRLVAYVVLQEGAALTAAELKAEAAKHLPAYMVPSAIVLLPELPLTPSGKIDRKALPAPDAALIETSRAYAEPRNAKEETLARIWSKALGLERVSIHDNFFELGGDSILSIQIVSRASQAGLKLLPKQLFDHQTVAELAAVVTEAAPVVADEGPVIGPVRLTPIQRWFFEQPLAEPHYWNQAMLLAVQQPVNGDALRQAIESLLLHHDALRLRYLQTESGWEQEIVPPGGELPWTRIDLSHLPEADQSAAVEREAECWQSSLNLTDGPVARAIWFDLGEDRAARLFLVVHHLAVDGVSWRILLEDLETAYEQARRGGNILLPPRTSSFLAWAEQLEVYANSDKLLEERAYWLASQHLTPQPLPLDYPVAEREIAQRNTYGSSETITSILEPEATRALLQEVPSVYRTGINDLLLTALARVHAEWTGHRSLVVGLEEHGREDLFEQLDLLRTVGWFTAMHPTYLELSPNGDMGQDIKRIKEQLRSVPHKGIGYGLLRYLRKDAEASEKLGQAAAPGILFNYLGQMEQAPHEAGLIGPAPESYGSPVSPTAPRENVLEINGVVSGKQLILNWTYSRELHRRETVERLAELYLSTLRELIAHCRSADAGGVTPSDFPLAGLTQEQLDRLYRADSRIRDIYPLTPMQAGMLFHSLATPDSGVYAEQSSFTFRGELDEKALEEAWRCLVGRYDIFRTRIEWEGLEQPLQIVQSTAAIAVARLDGRILSGSEGYGSIDAWLETWLAADRSRGFDFEHAPIMRVTLIRLGDDLQRLVWTFHHLLFDGWSTPIVIQEFFALYQAISAGQPLELEPVRPFRDYVAWLQKQDAAAAEAYWRQYLQGFEAATALSLNRPLSMEAGGYGELCLDVEESLSKELQVFARHHQLTLSTLVQAAWSILLSRYSGDADVVFGATVSGRPADLEGVESMVGLFINTLPVRVKISTDTDVLTWLKELQAAQFEQRQYEYSALTEIQGWSDVPHGTPLFESILVYENYPIQTNTLELASSTDATTRAKLPAEEAAAALAPSDTVSEEELELVGLQSTDQTNYPLSLSVIPGMELRLSLAYDAGRYSAQTIRGMLEHMRLLLEHLIRQPREKVDALPILTDSELEQIVAWNATDQEQPDEVIHDLIARQAELTPDAVAVVAAGGQLTYAELNCKADCLAVRLQAEGIGQESVVGILAERSVDLMTAVLAVWKAGGAYVPLDPNYPSERIAYMLEDSGARVLLTQSHQLDRTGEITAGASELKAVLLLDDEALYAADIVLVNGDTKSAIQPEPSDLAYIIYTSGTTGKPKGVMIEHGSLMSTAYAYRQEYRLTEYPVRLLQLASFSFDVFVGDIARTLINGGTMVICPSEDRLDPGRLYRWLMDYEITIFESTPALIIPVMDYIYQQGLQLPSMRLLITSSDSCSVADYRTLQERFSSPSFRIINAYGVTEAAIDSSYYEESLEQLPAAGNVPIGKPWANARFYIVDAQLNPVPVGVAGELCIGGRGVARGYLNRLELNAEKFIDNPFVPGERLYRTGDHARWKADGNVDFIGRIDHQVKIRGFRIELEEVEAALSALGPIRQTVTLVREDRPGEKRLVAYVLAEEGADVSASALKAELSTKLPSFMVPSAIVLLERLPLTVNGKLDRKALPAPEDQGDTRDGIVEPRNMIELRLQRMFEDVLQVPNVSVTDHFHDLGGHSLLAIRLMAKIQQEFGREVPLSVLLEGGTVETLARAVHQSQSDAPFSPLVTFQSGGSEIPLYFVHPAGGLVYAYTQLSKKLGSDQPFYAFQSRVLNGEEPGDIPMMAADYVEELQTARPHGPYRLGGWSTGGSVAYEMARLLHERGEEVDLLVLLDTPAFYEPSEDDELKLCDEALWARLMELPYENGLTLDQLVEVAVKREIVTEEMTVEQARTMIGMYRSNGEASASYVPGKYDGKVALIRVRNEGEMYREETMGWSGVALGGVDVVYVSGQHQDMMDAPYVDEVVAALRRFL